MHNKLQDDQCAVETLPAKPEGALIAVFRYLSIAFSLIFFPHQLHRGFVDEDTTACRLPQVRCYLHLMFTIPQAC